MRSFQSSYGRWAFNPATAKATINDCLPRLLDFMKTVDADAIAVIGKSGEAFAHMAQMVGDGVPYVVFRKPGVSSHGASVEGAGAYHRFVIVDDFVCSGETVRRLMLRIADENCETAGIAVYSEWRSPPGCPNPGDLTHYEGVPYFVLNTINHNQNA